MLHPKGKAWVRVSRPFPSRLGSAGRTSHPNLAHFPGPKGRADQGATEGGLAAAIPGLSLPPHPRLGPPVRAHSLTAGGAMLMLRSLPPRPVPLRPLRPLLSPEPV